jgi:Uma2 family endonuclease
MEVEMASAPSLPRSRAQVLHVPPGVAFDNDLFFDLCQRNPDRRMERTAEGEILIMPPVGLEGSHYNLDVCTQLQIWAKRDRTGSAFDSSAGYTLPSGAVRSPDASWIPKSRLATLTRHQKRRFAPICPDFVVEVRSETDRLSVLKDKMQEYIDNGARLGWLIDPDHRRVYVYRPNRKVEILDNAGTVSGDPVLPGFVLNLEEIWDF